MKSKGGLSCDDDFLFASAYNTKFTGRGCDRPRKRTAAAVIVYILSSVVCATHASGSSIRKFCSTKNNHTPPPYLFIASNTESQHSAIKRNTTIQNGTIFFSRKEGNALFHEIRIESGDCVLVNLNEAIRLEAVEVFPKHGNFSPYKSKKAPGSRLKANQSTFLPAVFFVQKNTSKQYGLIEEKMFRSLTPSKRNRETKTDEIINYATDRDLVLIYIICPPDRNSLCDLSMKRNGTWLTDAETGKKISMKVLARSRRDGGSTGASRRTRINSDTPQGIYSIWGTVTDGGDSGWHRLARIDLDAALPPMNGHPYNINSFLLSRIIPDEALDDYWVNEWPLAYSLGRIFLRIAPGGFESQQEKSIQMTFGDKTYSATHGCINTGDQQKKLLKALVQVGVFAQHEVFGRSVDSASKKWYIASKLGKAFVIIKDRD